jgi:nucleotide-binding universal stress UspA family protein
MHVLVVHNRYASAQPSGENKVVDQEVELLRGAGHRVGVFERRSDDIAARSLLGKAAVPLLVPWNPAVRAELAARLRAYRPDVVHVHNVFPLLSPSVLAACADAGLLVLARDGDHTRLGPRSLGHATRFVVDHAPCPVLLVWPEQAPDLTSIPPPPKGARHGQ